MARALITGIGGQDGAYLARLLLDSGYRVLGTSRDVAARDFAALRELGLEGRVELRSMTPDDPASVRDTLDWAEPDEVYALSSQSSVSLSFERPAETRASIVGAVHTLLEAVRQRGRGERVFHASSSECFGNLAGRPADEETPFNPLSPYGLAKAEAHALVARYRAAHGLFAVNGVMFNHESPLRPERFVTRKIAAAAARIAGGSGERIGRAAAAGQPGCRARLGLGARLRRCDVAHAPGGAAGRLRDRHRAIAQPGRVRLSRLCRCWSGLA